MARPDELTFAPLGGVGEIGMNLSIYGLGNRHQRSWLARAAGLGQPVAIRTGGSAVEGTFDSIDETGCLMVRTSGGRLVPISAGDVYFGSAASAGAA